MKFILDKLFGRGATLKRETVILCWIWISFIIVRVFAFVPPEHVQGYEYLISGVFWPVVILLGAIFGFQLAPSIGTTGRSETTTRVETPTQSVETKTTTMPIPTGPAMPEPPSDQ